MFASLPTFGKVRIARQEFLESDAVIHKKAF